MLNHSPERPAAVIVAVQLPEVDDIEHDANLRELGRLVHTLGFDVIATVSQRRPALAPAAVLGEGKLKDLAELTGGTGTIPSGAPARTSKARARREAHVEPPAAAPDEEGPRKGTVVVVDHEISPSQARNLERATGAQVLDRTGVIVEIFHRHARSREAKLQVEIARLTYVAPRLRETGGGADRQRGGIGGKGAGESALELDRRKIRDRIAELREELAAIQKEQDTRRAHRRGQRRVALVGYTNAGKSSLMRALTGSEVLVADALFATLDTTVRALYPEVRPRILVSDTVGFIKKLPHDLVASFRSTLDEALEASLLLYLADASDPTFRSQLEVTRTVLGELGAGEVPSRLLLNKADRLSAEERSALAAEFPEAIVMSAKDAADVARLRETILGFFEASMVEGELVIPYGKQGLIGEVYENARVLSEAYDEGGSRLLVRAHPAALGRLQSLLGGGSRRSVSRAGSTRLGRSLLVAALAALFVVNAAPGIGRWSGDALVHLAMAERFAEGRPFEFNAGEVASGTSSLGWTLLSAALFRLLGARAVVYGMPALAAVALLAAAGLTTAIARRLGASSAHAALGGLALLAIPGVAFNGVFPMEAGAFAAAVLGFVLALEGDLRRPGRLALAAALLATAILLRPEGLLLVPLPWVAWWWPNCTTEARRHGDKQQESPCLRASVVSPLRPFRPPLAVGLLAGLAAAAMVWAHHATTGRWLPGSAVSRVMAARRGIFALHLVGPLWVFGDAILRLLAYLPVPALAALGARVNDGAPPGGAGLCPIPRVNDGAPPGGAGLCPIPRVNDGAPPGGAGLCPIPRVSPPLARRLVLVAAGGVALYTFATGAFHAARLTLWIFAALCALVPSGVERAAKGPRARAVLAASVAAFLMTAGAETVARLRADARRGGGEDPGQILVDLAQRRRTTDELLSALCADGCCRAGAPARILVGEVQIRVTLDDRIAVDSLDGLTPGIGRPGVSFGADGCPDLEAVLADTNVVGVLERPDPGPRCRPGPLAGALTAAWGGGRAVRGWTWEGRIGGMIRGCGGR